MSRGLAALALGLAAACGGPSGGGDAGAIDASPVDGGIGCSATSPRTGAVTLSIGPDDWDDWTALIDDATTSLDLSMYLFTVTSVADRVIAAHNRGLDVRVLLDPDHQGNPTVRNRLSNAGVPVRNSPARFEFSHAKFAIIDGDTAAVLSGNFNVDAYSQERNYGVTLRDADDIADLQAIFDADWDGDPDPDLSCTRLLVSPVNGRSRVLAHVASAQTRLDLEVSYLSESSVRAAVIEAKNRGVAVRLLIASAADFDANAATIEIMTNQQIPVRIADGFYLHAKLMLADERALIGSHNYSATSLNDNREIGVIVDTPAVISAIETQFASDWAAADPP